MHEITTKKEKFNFNSFVGIVIFVVVCAVEVTMREQAKMIREQGIQITEIRTLNAAKIEQLNRIETQFDHLQQQVNEMQIELIRLKSK